MSEDKITAKFAEYQEANDRNFAALARSIVELRAENLALWNVLRKAVVTEWPPPELVEQWERIKPFRTAADSLRKTGVAQLPTLLESLARHLPE